ncbi:MAG: hypothetical protein JEZ11_06860 [Desulfobacterales bacterium]|nr:hypothetical protein [Desulfobacterales bacterium]
MQSVENRARILRRDAQQGLGRPVRASILNSLDKHTHFLAWHWLKQGCVSAMLNRSASSISIGPPEADLLLRESKSANAEVDFVVARGGRVTPIEVKSGKSGTLKSLQQFILNKPAPLAVRFDLNPPSIQNVSPLGLKTATERLPTRFCLYPSTWWKNCPCFWMGSRHSLISTEIQSAAILKPVFCNKFIR